MAILKIRELKRLNNSRNLQTTQKVGRVIADPACERKNNCISKRIRNSLNYSISKNARAKKAAIWALVTLFFGRKCHRGILL